MLCSTSVLTQTNSQWCILIHSNEGEMRIGVFRYSLTVDIESYQQFSIDSIVIIKSTKYNPLVVQPSCHIILMNTTSFRKGSRARDSTRAQLPDLIPAYLSLKIRKSSSTRTTTWSSSWEIVGTNPPAIRLLNPSFIYTMASEAISTAKLRVTAAERGLASATQMIKSATEQWVCIFYNNNNTYLYLCFNISYIACH